METNPLPVHKLPKWAQKYIHDLTGERDHAQRLLREFLDAQTVGAVSYREYADEKVSKSRIITRYIQTDRVEFRHAGVHLEVSLLNSDKEMFLSWRDDSRTMADVAFIPRTYCQASLKAKKHMR